MNVTIKDIDLLKAIQPQQMAKYLQAKGWQQQRQIAGKATIWFRENQVQHPIHIVLPLNPDVSDFPISMNLILEILEKAENRSQLDILSDLITNWNNVSLQGVVMQIQHSAEDIGSGSVILLGVVIDKLRKIHTHLSEPDYTLAIKAYQEHVPIICHGDLIKEDNVFILKNPHGFTLDEFWKN